MRYQAGADSRPLYIIIEADWTQAPETSSDTIQNRAHEPEKRDPKRQTNPPKRICWTGTTATYSIPPAYVSKLRGSVAPATFSLRKEVIQPQVLLRLPCYDFTPIMNHTLGRCLLAVSMQTSSTIHFRDVTGGVYKARERIHGIILIRHY